MNIRRPLTIRNNKMMHAMAAWLIKKNVTPNQISLCSVFFALLCTLSIVKSSGKHSWLAFILSSIFIQGRLLCNLLDGMVAIEGGKKTNSGELFNEIPDRFSDLLIIVPIGFIINLHGMGITLGWLAGTLAVMTAYVRNLHAFLGSPVDFQGPMAKQHRMAVLTLSFLLTAVESYYASHRYVLIVALLLIIIGCFITIMRRILDAYHYLECNHE